jgi:hypothetical protein
MYVKIGAYIAYVGAYCLAQLAPKNGEAWSLSLGAKFAPSCRLKKLPPVSSVAGGDDTTRPRRQYYLYNCNYDFRIYSYNASVVVG